MDGQLARAWFLTGENTKAVEVADRVLAIAERANLVDIVADTLITRGSALAGLGRRYEGIGVIEAGQRLAEANSLHDTVARAFVNLASFRADEDPRSALEAAQEGIALARRLGSRSFQLMDNAVTGAIRTGEWDWADAELEPLRGEDTEPVVRSVMLSDSIMIKALRGEPTDALVADYRGLPADPGDTVKAAGTAWSQGILAFADGRFDVARREFLSFRDIFPGGGDEAMLFASRCDILAGHADLARADIAQVDKIAAPRSGDRRDRTTIHAGIAALEGRTEEALAAYRQVLAVWRDLGLVWDEALCAIDMATVLDPSDPEVRAVAEAAREILVRLRATPFIERLDAALARAAEAQPDEAAATAEDRRVNV